jgi:hypothetical protein
MEKMSSRDKPRRRTDGQLACGEWLRRLSKNRSHKTRNRLNKFSVPNKINILTWHEIVLLEAKSVPEKQSMSQTASN